MSLTSSGERGDHGRGSTAAGKSDYLRYGTLKLVAKAHIHIKSVDQYRRLRAWSCRFITSATSGVCRVHHWVVALMVLLAQEIFCDRSGKNVYL